MILNFSIMRTIHPTFDIVSPILKISNEETTHPTFDNESVNPVFRSSGIKTFYEIKIYDRTWVSFGILMDFIEARSIGDVF